MDYIEIIENLYKKEAGLKQLLLTHSRNVANKALSCIECHGMKLDIDFVIEAAMLHDIGIIFTNAPAIGCRGELPYLCHGIKGREYLDSIGLKSHALICERHTGAGMSAQEIRQNSLPLPERDMLPISMEEKLICYADKFFSKSGDPCREKSIEEILKSIRKFGKDAESRFIEMHKLFGES